MFKWYVHMLGKQKVNSCWIKTRFLTLINSGFPKNKKVKRLLRSLGIKTVLSNNFTGRWSHFLHTFKKNHTHVKKVGHTSECPKNVLTLKSPKNQNFEKMKKNCFTHVYQKPQSYEVQFRTYRVRPFFFLSFCNIFWPFLMPGDIITLHWCTTNDNHMMCGSWNIKRNRHNFLSLWASFCPLPPNNSENQNFEKMKKTPRDIIILHMSTINKYDMM